MHEWVQEVVSRMHWHMAVALHSLPAAHQHQAVLQQSGIVLHGGEKRGLNHCCSTHNAEHSPALLTGNEVTVFYRSAKLLCI